MIGLRATVFPNVFLSDRSLTISSDLHVWQKTVMLLNRFSITYNYFNDSAQK